MSRASELPVYRRALAAAIELDRVASGIRRARPELSDQLRRASASILLNLAEGAAEFSPAEKARFYRISRRSAGECLAVLDLIEGIFGRLAADARLKDELDAIIGSLTGERQRRTHRDKEPRCVFVARLPPRLEVHGGVRT